MIMFESYLIFYLVTRALTILLCEISYSIKFYIFRVNLTDKKEDVQRTYLAVLPIPGLLEVFFLLEYFQLFKSHLAKLIKLRS